MRTRFLGLGLIVVIAGTGPVLLSCWGQTPAVPPGQATVPPRPPGTPPAAPGPLRLTRDVKKLPFAQQQLYFTAQRGTEWLLRANKADGRFVSGLVPALRITLTEENIQHQAAAAFTVARAARFFQDERAAAVARQAVLTLLLATELDARNPQIRQPAFLGSGPNRIATAGWLVLAINELPSPGADLLVQSDQLCNFIRSRQQADGSLACNDNPADARDNRAEPEGVKQFPGPALYGLALSLRHKKADWKLDVLRKARVYYHDWWRKHKNPEMIACHSAACAEAFFLTREKAFADCVWEMNDWLCALQYRQLDPRHSHWIGGFKGWEGSGEQLVAPDVHGARYLEGLALACRLARETGDVQRFKTYREALECSGQFLSGLQYTTANTQHFAEWYRTEILGAFHPSHQDGNLRLDYTQEAVCGLLRYLMDVADPP
jgi:hypothetical protein